MVHKNSSRKQGRLLNKSANTLLLYRVFLYTIAALIIALIAHQSMIARMIVSDGYKVGVPLASSRTDPKDNYVYFGLLKRGYSSCRREADISSVDATGNPLACSYISAVIISSAIYDGVGVFFSSQTNQLAALMITQTAFLIFSFLVALSCILNRSFGLFVSILISFLFLISIEVFSLSFYYGYPYTRIGNIWRFEPNIARLVNPTTMWAMGFFSLAGIVKYFDSRSVIAFAFACLGILLTSASSIVLGLALGAAVGLHFVWSSVRERKFSYPLFGIGIAVGLGLFWQAVQFISYRNNSMGENLRHGGFTEMAFAPHYLILIIPMVVIGARSGNCDSAKFLRFLMLISLLVGSICLSFELGSRIWLRGVTIFAFIFVFAWLINLLAYVQKWSISLLGGYLPPNSWCLRIPKLIQLAAPLVVLITVASLSIATFKPVLAGGWSGYIEKDKFDVLQWISKNATEDEAIASTNIEDSELIEYYTDAIPFVPLYGLTALSWQEGISRYFHVISLLNSRNFVIQRINDWKELDRSNYFKYFSSAVRKPVDYDEYQAAAFYHLIVYYPYALMFKDILSEDGVTLEFRKKMAEIYASSQNRNYCFKFLIVRHNESLRNSSEFTQVFSNENYTILKPRILGVVSGNMCNKQS